LRVVGLQQHVVVSGTIYEYQSTVNERAFEAQPKDSKLAHRETTATRQH
jgi:hypothetical protein